MNYPLGIFPRFVLFSTLTMLFVCSVAMAQTPTIGVKIGVPIMEPFLQTAPSTNYSFKTPRLTVGPAVGLNLNNNLSVEANALWRRLHYQTTVPAASTTATTWELPFLFKASLPGEGQPVFGDLGFSFRHTSGKTQLTSTIQRDPPLELANSWSGGLVAGGGLNLTFHSARFLPEVRYTRWRTPGFSGNGGLFTSNLNQLDLILGLAFVPK